jgi:hypothetical protein
MIVNCNLSTNGYRVTSSALVDTRANGFVFINTLFAYDIAKLLGLKAQRLPYTIGTKGYDGKAGERITHYLRLHITVDGRRQYNIPLLILDLGSHDLILGRKWLAYFDILPDCRRGCLRWPSELPPSQSAVKEITIARDSLNPWTPKALKASYQLDTDLRD